MNEHGNHESYIDHLGELRRRLIWVGVVFLLTLIVSFIYASDIFFWLSQDAMQGVKVHALNPSDPLRVYMQISFICACVFTSPFLFYHLWQFVRPGLSPQEQRAAFVYIPVAFVLFFVGLLFAYYIIFPNIILFVERIAEQLGVTPLYGLYQYISFMLNIVFPLAILFELPVIVLFLTRIRIVTPSMLRRVRRVAYLILIILATLITPPDLISNIMVIIPLVLLYEISVWLSSWLYGRMEKENAD